MASTSGATDDVMNFDTDGRWNLETNEEPAAQAHAPPSVRSIVLTGSLRVEFLDVSTADFYPKNNIIMSATFLATGGGHESARLSVDVASIGNVNQALNIPYLSLTLMFKPRNIFPDRTIQPVAFTIALLKYSTCNHSTAHSRMYALREGTTLGMLVDEAISKKLHHFLLLPYTTAHLFKGCGDFLCLSSYSLSQGMLTRVFITSPSRLGCPGPRRYPMELTRTYLKAVGGHLPLSTRELIRRGWWLSWNPIQDDLTPEEVFSDRRTTYLLN